MSFASSPKSLRSDDWSHPDWPRADLQTQDIFDIRRISVSIGPVHDRIRHDCRSGYRGIGSVTRAVASKWSRFSDCSHASLFADRDTGTRTKRSTVSGIGIRARHIACIRSIRGQCSGSGIIARHNANIFAGSIECLGRSLRIEHDSGVRTGRGSGSGSGLFADYVGGVWRGRKWCSGSGRSRVAGRYAGSVTGCSGRDIIGKRKSRHRIARHGCSHVAKFRFSDFILCGPGRWHDCIGCKCSGCIGRVDTVSGPDIGSGNGRRSICDKRSDVRRRCIAVHCQRSRSQPEPHVRRPGVGRCCRRDRSLTFDSSSIRTGHCIGAIGGILKHLVYGTVAVYGSVSGIGWRTGPIGHARTCGSGDGRCGNDCLDSDVAHPGRSNSHGSGVYSKCRHDGVTLLHRPAATRIGKPHRNFATPTYRLRRARVTHRTLGAIDNGTDLGFERPQRDSRL
jgi:hypothetical protein